MQTSRLEHFKKMMEEYEDYTCDPDNYVDLVNDFLKLKQDIKALADEMRGRSAVIDYYSNALNDLIKD